MRYQAALHHLSMMVGFEPTTFGPHVLRTGSRIKINNTRRNLEQRLLLSYHRANWLRNGDRTRDLALLRSCPCTPHRQSGVYQKRPTKLWSETGGALPLSYSAVHSGLRWWDSNPRPPAYEACTPNRQSVLYRWPGDEEMVRTLLYPVELHPPFDCRVDDRIRTDNTCTPTGSRRGQGQLQAKTANEENGSDMSLKRCSLNRQLAVRDAGGNRTHFCRVAAGRLAIWLQRQVSSSGVEPDPRPSQSRVHPPHPEDSRS